MPFPPLAGYVLVGTGVFACLWIVFGEPAQTSPALTGVVYSRIDLCRATISAVMGTPVDTIRPDSGDASVVHTIYVRGGDNTVWRNRCNFSGNRIVWATPDGRWRDRKGWDEAVTYAVDANTGWLVLTLTYSDGSAGKREFSPYNLRKPPMR